MRTRDHLRLIARIARESGLVTFIIAIGLIYTILDASYQYLLTESAQQTVTEMVRNMFGYWLYALIFTLILIIILLYKRLVPRVDIVFVRDDGRFFSLIGGVRRYRVDCVNMGDVGRPDISFRLDYLQREDGQHLIPARRGLLREAGVGPMPLSPDSPKSGYLVEMDESKQDAKVRILTVADLKDQYKNDPIDLPHGSYFMSVSLNPPAGRPCRRVFKISVVQYPREHRYGDALHKLIVEEVSFRNVPRQTS